MTKERYGYMCRVDFEWEIGEALPYTRVYPSITALKEQRKCVKNCGIVKVKVTLEGMVQQPCYEDYDES